MSTIPFYVERPVECACLALSATPFAACPECDGCGEALQEIALVVKYRIWPGSEGSLWCPPEEEYIEIEAITDEQGREVELTRLEESRVDEACFADVADRAARYAED